MKRMTAFLMAALLVLSLASCNMGGGKETMDSAMDTKSMDTMDGKQDMDSMDSMEPFPAFEGMDLEGNMVKSEELFGSHAATVVNFWFTTCGPCVGELSELDALNRELSQKGAALIGINAFTLGGDQAAIAEAKDVLAQKGASYQNVYFDSDSPAGVFASRVLSFPTTYVVDRTGAVVGDPIVGALTGKKQMDLLHHQLDQALAKDMESM